MMFSGIIGYRGVVVEREPRANGGATLRMRCEGIETERPGVKDSIAVNGVCLTATSIEGDVVTFDVVPETLARSTLGELANGDRVNLEYPVRAGEPFGGHFVYGHVDAAACILSRAPEGQGERVRIESPRSLSPMLAEKSFVAVDGVSLTVAAAGDGWFEVAIVPETRARTTLGERPAGSRVNLEGDPIARHVLHILAERNGT